jgi:hypothetical protein
MLDFNVETRLSTLLFKESPFFFTGSDWMSFPLGRLPNIIEHESFKLQRFHPFTVSKLTSEDLWKDQMTCFSFFYINDSNELSLFITHPHWFERSNSRDCLNFFLEKISELARYIKCKKVLLEFHEKFISAIAFPTSISDFSYDLSHMQIQKEDFNLYRKIGFKTINELYSFESNIIEFLESEYASIPYEEYIIKSISPSKLMNVKTEENKYPVHNFSLSRKDVTTSSKYIPSFADDSVIVAARAQTSIGSLKSSFEGYLQWSPNLFEPFIEKQTPSPYLFIPFLNKFGYASGKIYKWAIKEKKIELLTCLISQAISNMNIKGIKKCQISYIEKNQKFIINTLRSLGFHKVHTIKLMQKEVR